MSDSTSSTSSSGLELSVSNIRPKASNVSGIDLTQPPMEIFEAAMAAGNLTVARAALLAHRQQTKASQKAPPQFETRSAKSTAHNAIANGANTEQDRTNETVHDSASRTTVNQQGGRLERIVSDIENEIRAEYEANWQNSINALNQLEDALSTKSAMTTELEQRVTELEESIERQRTNHGAQVEQLTREYEQQLQTLQNRNQELIHQYDQRIDQLSVSRETTLDELEAAWNSISDEKQRLQADLATQKDSWEKRVEAEQAALLEMKQQLQNEFHNRVKQLEAEAAAREEHLDREKKHLEASRAALSDDHEMALKRLTNERESLEREREAWRHRQQREESELASQVQSSERELSRIRAEISRERAEWDATRERRTSKLNEELAAHQREVDQAKTELSLISERHKQVESQHAQRIEDYEKEFKQRADRQRMELDEELSAQRAAWRHEEESERAKLKQEKESLRNAVEQLQMLLARRKEQHQAELAQMRADNEKANREWSESERSRLELEFEAARNAIVESRIAFENEKAEWEKERAQQAAMIRQEQSRLASELDRLQTRETELEAERTDLQNQRAQLDSEQQQILADRAKSEAELEAMRSEATKDIQAQREKFFTEEQMQRQEFLDRQRLCEEKLRQQEAEATERRRQLEHDFENQKHLHQNEIDRRKADWEDYAKSVRSELEIEQRAVNEQRDQLARERKLFEEETSAAMRKLEQDRHMLHDGLQHMDAQLKWVANHLGQAQDVLPFVRSIDVEKETILKTGGISESNELPEVNPNASATEGSNANPVDSNSQNSIDEFPNETDSLDSSSEADSIESETRVNEANQDDADSADNGVFVTKDLVEESPVDSSDDEKEVAIDVVVDVEDEGQLQSEMDVDIDLDATEEELQDESCEEGGFEEVDQSADAAVCVTEVNNGLHEEVDYAMDADDHSSLDAHELVNDESAENSFDQGWVQAVREPDSADSSMEDRIPQGVETEWACVVQTTFGKHRQETQEANEESSVSRECLESDTESSMEVAPIETPATDNEISEEERGEKEKVGISPQSTDQNLTVDSQDVTGTDISKETEVADAEPSDDEDAGQFHRIDERQSDEQSESERKKTLQDYRVKLLDLQSQLGDLKALGEQSSIED